MRFAGHAPTFPRALAAACALLVCCGAVRAAPDEATDPLHKSLVGSAVSASASAAAVTGNASEPAAAVDAPALLRRVGDHASEAVLSAMNFIGVRYKRGGNSAETGFDCSGFTRFVFENSLGLVLPRQADQQARAAGLVAVKREDLQPGDLVFFNTMRRTFSHVGIYIGDNRFIHAPSHGKDVRTDDLGFAYWAKRFTGARRAGLPASVLPEIAAAPVEPSKQ